MRRYGIPLGVIALVHLLGLWGIREWRVLAFFPVALLALALLRTASGQDGNWRALASSENAPYAAWTAATLVVFSSALNPPFDVAVWAASAVLAAVFWIAGLPYIWGRRTRIDLAQIAWFTPALVAALYAPQEVAYALRNSLGWAGFCGMAGVLLLSTWRLLRAHDPIGLRSRWYGAGGSAVMGLWLVDALPRDIAMAIILALCVIACLWIASIFHRHAAKTQGAWSSLFSICSMAALALRLHIGPIAATLTVAALVVALWDAWQTAVETQASRSAARIPSES